MTGILVLYTGKSKTGWKIKDREKLANKIHFREIFKAYRRKKEWIRAIILSVNFPYIWGGGGGLKDSLNT